MIEHRATSRQFGSTCFCLHRIRKMSWNKSTKYLWSCEVNQESESDWRLIMALHWEKMQLHTQQFMKLRLIGGISESMLHSLNGFRCTRSAKVLKKWTAEADYKCYTKASSYIHKRVRMLKQQSYCSNIASTRLNTNSKHLRNVAI